MCTEGDLAVRFTPYLAGDRQSLTPKQASFTGLTLDATRRQMLAALLLAMHEPMRDVIGIYERQIAGRDAVLEGMEGRDAKGRDAARNSGGRDAEQTDMPMTRPKQNDATGRVIKLTGGMATPAFADLKRRLFPRYAFEIIDDCPIVGSARLAVEVNTHI